VKNHGSWSGLQNREPIMSKSNLPRPARCRLAVLILLAALPVIVQAQSAQQWIAQGRLALRDKSTARLFDANNAFTQAAKLDPNNDEAVVLKGITSFLLESQNPRLLAVIRDLGVTIANPDIYNASFIPTQDADGVLVPVAGKKTGGALAYLNSRRSFVDGLLADAKRITDPSIRITFDAQETGENRLVIDYADIRMLRAFLHFVKAFTALANSHNVSAEYKLFYDLLKQEKLSPREVLRRLPNLLKFTSTDQRRAARVQLQSALSELRDGATARAASPSLPENTQNLITITESPESLVRSLAQIQFFAAALSGAIKPSADWGLGPDLAGKRVDLSRFFSTTRAPRSLLPRQFSEDGGFLRGSWPDKTIAGILPDGDPSVIEPFGGALLYKVGRQTLFLLEPAIYRAYKFDTLKAFASETMLYGIAAEAGGSVVVVDASDATIKRIAANGQVVTTLVTSDQVPSSSQMSFSIREGVAADGQGRIYFTDGTRVLRRNTDGSVAVVAGLPPDIYQDPKDGTGSEAVFRQIGAMVADSSGTVYLIDNWNTVRKVSPLGQVTTLAGRADKYGKKDGPGSQAEFSFIYGSIGIDAAGNVYLNDSGNHAIRKVAPNGLTSTLLGGGNDRRWFHYDGKLKEAVIDQTRGVTADPAGNVFFADNTTIRQIATDGMVVTLGGRPQTQSTPGQQVGGVGKRAKFGLSDDWDEQINALAVNSSGVLFAANQRRVLRAEKALIITGQPSSISAYNGESVEFRVTASSPTAIYQWYRNGVAITGANQATYKLRTSSNTAGTYRVEVTDNSASETSSEATLTMKPNASWSWVGGTSDRTRSVGESLMLEVESLTGPPGLLNCQWLRNGRPIPGATSRKLTLPSIKLEDGGAYSLVITSSAGRINTESIRALVRDEGLLVYRLSGTGMVATAQGRAKRKEQAFSVIDRNANKAVLIWYSASSGGKIYRVENPADVTVTSTGPYTGSTSVVSSTLATGQRPSVERDVIWFAGTDAVLRVKPKSGEARTVLGPPRMSGSVNTISLSGGVAIEMLDASMVLDSAQTWRTRAGQRESLEAAVQRITGELVAEGYANAES